MMSYSSLLKQFTRSMRGRVVSALGLALGLVLVLLVAAVYIVSARAGEPRAVDAELRAWVNELDSEQLTPTRHLAQQKLEEAGPAAVGPLVTALHSPNSTLRRNSAEMLGYVGSPLAVSSLADVLLQDPVPSVRNRAAWALGELGLPAVESLRIAAAVDSDAGVRTETEKSLQAIGVQLARAAGTSTETAGPFAVAPNTPELVYLGEFNSLAVSRDGGRTWTYASSKLPSRITALAVSPRDSNTVFAGTESMGLYKTTDGGATWTPANAGLGLEPGVRLSVTALAVDAEHPDRLYAARGVWLGTSSASFVPLGVMLSVDAGASWQTSALAETRQPVRHLAIRGGRIYAAAGTQVISAPV